jgi:hypothetical protein
MSRETKVTAVESMYLIMFEKQGRISREEFDIIMDMQKEQILIAYSSDRFPCSEEDAEQYYTETYKP